MAIFAAVPFNLTNGSLADATQVMADFNQLVANGNANAAPLASPAFSGTVTMPDASTWAGTGISNAVSLGVNRTTPGTGIVDISGTYRIGGVVQAIGPPGQLPGTTTNDAASAGNVGQYLTNSLASPGAGLSNGNAGDLLTLGITAGDWDVSGNVWFAGNAATTVTYVIGAINTAASLPLTLDGQAQQALFNTATFSYISAISIPVGPIRVSVAGSTTYHLIAQSGFAVNSLNAYGILRARRMR